MSNSNFKKVISIIVICLFTINNLVWANPELFSQKPEGHALQPALFSQGATAPLLIETALAYYSRAMGPTLADIDLHLYPTVNGERVDLYFNPAGNDNNHIVVNARVGSESYVAMVSKENGDIKVTEKLYKPDAVSMDGRGEGGDMAERFKELRDMLGDNNLRSIEIEGVLSAYVALVKEAANNHAVMEEEAPKGFKALRGKFEDTYSYTRYNAVMAYGSLAEATANNADVMRYEASEGLKRLRSMFTDKDIDVQSITISVYRKLVKALANNTEIMSVEAPKEFEVLRSMFKDKDVNVSYMALIAYGELAKAVLEKSPGLFVKVYNDIRDLASQGEIALAGQIIDSVPPITVKMLESIEEDWAVVIRTIGEDTGYTISNEEFKEILLLDKREARTLEAIKIKQRVYRKWRTGARGQWHVAAEAQGAKAEGVSVEELRVYPIDEKDVDKYIWIYQNPWGKFVEFMEKNYDEFHQNPDKYRPKDPAVMADMGDGEITDGDNPEAASMAGGEDEAKIIRLEEILNSEDLAIDSYWAAAAAIGNIARNKPELMRSSTIEALESVLSREGLKGNTYKWVAEALSYIARNNPELIRPETIESLEGVLNREGLESDAYEVVASAIYKIAIRNPEIIRSATIESLEKVLKHEELESNAYIATARAITEITRNKPELIVSETIEYLENVLKRGDLESNTYGVVANAISEIAINKRELITSSTIESLEAVLNNRIGLESYTYNAAANAISSIARNRPDLSQQAMKVLEGVLKRKDFESNVYWSTANTISNIAINKRELITSSTIESLEAVLDREGLRSYAYESSAKAISDIAKNKPELFAEVYGVYKRLMDKGAMEKTQLLIVKIIENLPEEISPSVISKIKGEDWPIVIGTIPDETGYRLKKEELVEILGKDRDDARTLTAILIKDKIYREWKSEQGSGGKGEGSRVEEMVPVPDITLENLSLYTGFYQNKWEMFIKYYDGFHRNPKKFMGGIETADLGDGEITDGELGKPEAPSMAGSQDAPVIRRLEKILNKKGLENTAYAEAARGISDITKYYEPDLGQQAIGVLERVLTREDLKSDVYWIAVNAIYSIFGDKPELIRLKTIESLEKVLTREGLESNAYGAAAYVISNIAKNKPELIRLKTIESLEKVLTREGLISDAYWRAADAISDIAINKLELRQRAMEVLEGALNREGLENTAYAATARGISNISKNNPGLFAEVYDVYKRLKDRGLMEKAELLINEIIKNLPEEGLSPSVIGKIKDEEDPENWPVVIGTIPDETGYRFKKEELAGIMRGESDEERTLAAILIKDKVYREWKLKSGARGQGQGAGVEEMVPVPTITIENVSYYTGFYIHEWEDFVRDYEAFHLHPEKFIKGLETADLGDWEIPDEMLDEKPEAASMAGGENEAELIRLEEILNEKDLENNAYQAAAKKISDIVKYSKPELSQRAIESLIGVLKREGLESYAYYAAANAISGIAYTKLELIRPATIESLEGVLNREGLVIHAYRAVAGVIPDIARNKRELNRLAIESLERVLNREGLESYAYNAAASAISDIAKDNIHRKNLEINQRAIESLERVLNHEGLGSDAYWSADDAISYIARNKPELFAEVYGVYRSLMKKGAMENAELLIIKIKENLPEEISPSVISKIKGEDWPIVIGTIPDETEFALKKEDLRKILEAKSEDEKTALAIKIKQMVYRELKLKSGDRGMGHGASVEEGLDVYEIKPEYVNNYPQYYWEWEKFVEFMDAHYDEFHKNPDTFLEKDLVKTAEMGEGEIGDELDNPKAASMAGVEDEDELKRLEAILKTPGLSSAAYEAAVDKLDHFIYSWTGPEFLPNSKVVELLGNLLKSSGLDGNSYITITSQLRYIAWYIPGLFDRVYGVYKNLIDEGFNERAQMLLEYLAKIPQDLAAKVSPSAIGKIKGEDWPVVIGTIPDETGFALGREDLRKILEAKSEDEKTALAIKIKQMVYRELKLKSGDRGKGHGASVEETALKEYEIKPEYVNNYPQYYWEWEKFVEFMDAHYDEFHKNPDTFLEKDLVKTAEMGEGEIGGDLDNPEAASMAEEGGEYISARFTALRKKFGDEDDDVRDSAVETYYELGESLSHSVKRMSVEAPKEFETLRAMFQDEDWNVRDSAIRAYDNLVGPLSGNAQIMSIEVPKGFEALLSRLQDEEGIVKTSALMVYCSLLEEALLHNTEIMRIVALKGFETLRAMFPDEYVDNPVKTALSSLSLMLDEDMDFRANVVGKYGDLSEALSGNAEIMIIEAPKGLEALFLVMFANNYEAARNIAAKAYAKLSAASLKTNPGFFKEIYEGISNLYTMDEYGLAELIMSKIPEITIPMLKSMEGENWPIVIRTIGEETGYKLSKDEFKEILSLEKEDAKTALAIKIKQKVYREWKSGNGASVEETPLKEYEIKPEDVNNYPQYYYVWGEFVEFMDKNYDEFHKNPDSFLEKDLVKTAEMGDGVIPDDKFNNPEAASIGEGGKEDRGALRGDTANPYIIKHIREKKAVQVNEKNETVMTINRDGTAMRAPPVEEKLRSNGTFEKIRQAKDKNLLANTLNKYDNFSSFSPADREKIIDIVQEIQLSVILGHGLVARTKDEIHAAHARTGFSKIVHKLQSTVWIGEKLLEKLSAEELSRLLLEECQHILGPPKKVEGQWVNIHGHGIWHDNDFTRYVLKTAGSLEPPGPVEEVAIDEAWEIVDDIKSQKMTAEEATVVIEGLINSGREDVAGEVAVILIKKGKEVLRDLPNASMIKWRETFEPILPTVASSIERLHRVRLDIYLKNPENALGLFNYFKHRFSGIVTGMDTTGFGEKCIAIIKNETDGDVFNPKIDEFIRKYFDRMLGHRAKLTEEEETLIRTLSVDITRTVIEARKSRRLRNAGELTFREGMRFNKIFSRYYLKDMEVEISRVFEYFILVAWTVYGRFIRPEDREAFVSVLVDVFNREAYRRIFLEASAQSGMEVTTNEALRILNFGRFEQGEPEGLISSERKILAAVERARSAGMPSFIFTPHSYFPDAVVKTLSKEPGSVVFPITMSGFTQRKEFFGMNLPDSEGKVSFLSGAIARVSEYASRNPGKRVYFVLENPDFASGDIRMALHQFLLERKATLGEAVDEKGAKKGEVTLPDNLEIVLTMESTSEIGDESFMDRSSGYFLEEVTASDLEEYIVKNIGLSEEIARYLASNIYAPVKKNKELSDKIAVQDIVEIAYYLSGRISDNNITEPLIEVARQEAALHLSTKFSPVMEKPAITELEKIVGKIPGTKIEISKDGKSILFNGIRLDIDESSKFGAFIKKEMLRAGKVPTFSEALIGFLPKDYFLTSTEERIFVLLARVYKYALSKVVFLQGLPGGGKTTIARIFLDITGHNLNEYTLNKEADLSVFRGSLSLDPASPDGLSMRIAEYWRALRDNNNGVIINEADTRIKLLEWLWPVIGGRKERYGWEYASTDDNNPMGIVNFGAEQIHIFTGNIRKDMLPILESHIPATYRMERSEDDMLKITEKMFLSRWGKMPDGIRRNVSKKSVIEKARITGNIYNSIAKAVREERFGSKREITPRQIERFKDIFFHMLENGMDFDDSFKFTLDIVFVSMWDNHGDMNIARDIILTFVSDLSPPLSSEERLDWLKEFPLDIPLLILTNGTTDSNTIRNTIMSAKRGANEEVIPLSRFHNKKSLIGGLNPSPDEKQALNELGILSHLILHSHLKEEKTVAWMPGYLNLNPQVAPLLNEFFQTNWLEVEEILDDHMIEDIMIRVGENRSYSRLASDYYKVTGETLPDSLKNLSYDQRKRFSSFLIGYKPVSLSIIAIGTSDEPLSLHPADIDRFFTVNISEEYGMEWIDNHLNAALATVIGSNLRRRAIRDVEHAYKLYEEERKEDLYPHNRLGRSDIDIFIDEIKKRAAKGELNEDILKLIAYHTLGIGLTKQEENIQEGLKGRDYRKAYLEAIGLDQTRVVYKRKFIKEGDEVYFIITAEIRGKEYELVKYPTRYTDFEKVDDYGRFMFRESSGMMEKVRLQAPTQALLSQQVSQIIFASRGTPAALEGDPGGGKTSGSRDISKLSGRPYYEEGMYKWISLGALLGSMSIRGKDIVLSTLDKDSDGHYLIPFLRMYEEGGTFIADEGMVSKNAGYLLRWMVEANLLDEIDLGAYHPGLQGIKVKRHPDFTLSITQNDHFKTAGRNPLPWEIDRRSGKIRVDNILTQDDARVLIEYYLEGSDIDHKLMEDLARLHILLSREHPQKRMISPRDLIDTVLLMVKYSSSLYEAISVNYLEGVIETSERAKAISLIKEIFPEFAEGKYESVVLDSRLPAFAEASADRHGNDGERGYSNIDREEIAHIEEIPTYILKARVMEKMLGSAISQKQNGEMPGRQVLIHEDSGANGIEFLKLFSYLTKRKLFTVEGHPYVTAKLLLTGDSFEFDDQFDDNGARKAKEGFKKTYGAIGRHLIKKEELAAIPEEERVPSIIAITNVESIPKNELVKLNELIATRSIIMEDPSGRLTTYVLPPWITIVPITSDIDSLTSPFANRFRKIGLGSLTNAEELRKTLQMEYPNLTDKEADILSETAILAGDYSQNQRLEIDYNFTLAEVRELSLRVQMYKQVDQKRGVTHDDPLWYAMKAINFVILQAMAPEDRKVFIKGFIEKILSPRLSKLGFDQIFKYVRKIIKKIREEARQVTWRDYEHRAEFDDFNEKILRLPNGMRINKQTDAFTVITDGEAYKLSWNNLGSDWVILSEGLSVRKDGNSIILKEKLVSGIGVSELSSDEANLERSLPLEEMSIDDFMYPAASLIDSINALEEAHTPVLTATGRLIRPRVVLMAGETGSGKTTIPKMLSKAEGAPIVRINPWRQMHASKLTVSLAFGKTVEMTVSDFLLSVGKVNGKRISAAYPTSNSMRILIDEANVTRDAWYVLDAISRGESKFMVETPAGDEVEVELDKDIQIVLTFNPPERYGGTGKGSNRYKFPAPLAAKAVKIYTSEPIEDYSDDEMRAIMKEVYRRGEAYFARREIMESLGISDSDEKDAGGFFPVADSIFEVKEIKEVEKKSLDALEEEINKEFPKSEAAEKKGLSGEEIEEIRKRETEKYTFYPEKLRQTIDEYSRVKYELSRENKFIFFMNRILNEAIKGIALHDTFNDTDKPLYEELKNKVIEAAGEIDSELAHIIGDLVDLSNEEKISELKIRAIMARLDRVSRKHGSYLENLNAVKGRPFITYTALHIVRQVKFDDTLLKRILGGETFTAVFGDTAPSVLVVVRPEDGTLGYFDGKDLISSFLDDEGKEYEVASHELGHLISERAAKKGNWEIHERLRKNVELYSHLFPIMFVSDPKGYIRETLLEKIKNRVKDNDSYALSSVAVLNAYARENGIRPVSQDFDEGEITAIVSKINTLSNEELVKQAIKFWQNPAESFPMNVFPLDRYGKYYSRQIVIKGASGGVTQTFTLSDGPEYKPRIEVIESIEADLGPSETDKTPEKEFVEDRELTAEPGPQGPAKGLPSVLRAFMKKYEELFAKDDNGDDIEVRYVSEGGTDVNVEALITGNADELLIAPQYEDEEKSLAQNVFFIMDVSGSIQSAPDLQDAIETMLRHYSSFLLELSRKNRDLNIGIATISTKLSVLFDFTEWKQTKSHSARRALLEEAIDHIWTTGDGGGIDTPALLDRLSSVDFPSTGAKDVKNLVVVFTDGQETGRATGDSLKTMVRDFREGMYVGASGKSQIQQRQHIDMAFVGVMLDDGGRALDSNYPARLNVGDESAEAYLEALFKMAYMQAKGMPIDGDLSETVHQLGQEGKARATIARSKAPVIARSPHEVRATKQSNSSFPRKRESTPLYSINPFAAAFTVYFGWTGATSIFEWTKDLIITYPLIWVVPVLGVVIWLTAKHFYHLYVVHKFEKLRGMFKDEDIDVRARALRAYVELVTALSGSKEIMKKEATKGFEELRSMFKDEYVYVRSIVILAYGELAKAISGSEEIMKVEAPKEFEKLRSMFKDDDWNIRVGVLNAYGELAMAVLEKSPGFFVKVYDDIRDLTAQGQIDITDKIIDNVPPITVKMLESIGEDWPIVIRTIGEETGYTMSKEEFKDILLAPSDNQRTALAIKIKQSVYREWKLKSVDRGKGHGASVEETKLKEYEINPEDVNNYPQYYYVWDKFVEFMDKNYDAFHRNPGHFIKDEESEEIDMGDVEIVEDGKPQAPSMSRNAKKEDELKRLESIIMTGRPYSWDNAVSAIKKIIENDPNMFRKSILDALKKVLMYTGFQKNSGILSMDNATHSYWGAVDIIKGIVVRKHEFSDEGYKTLEDILLQKGLNKNAYWATANGVRNVITDSPDLRERGLAMLENLLTSKELDRNRYTAITAVFRDMTRSNPEIIRESTLDVLEEALIQEVFVIGSYWNAAVPIWDISRKRPDLIKESTLIIMEGILTHKGLEADMYKYTITNIIVDITKARPDLFAKIYALQKRLEREGNNNAELLLESIIGNLPEEVPPSVIGKIKVKEYPEDWPMVIGTIPDGTGFKLKKEDLKKILLAESEDEKTTLAIEIKQRVYRDKKPREGINLSPYPITKENVRDYRAHYHHPWEDFVEFMDAHYDEFHENPDAFLKEDLAETAEMGEGVISHDKFANPEAASMDTTVLRDISNTMELVKCIKESTLSQAFSGKLVLAFENDLTEYQYDNPMRMIVEALNELKKNDAYKKILSNLIIVPSNADEMANNLKEYLNDNNAKIFVFARDIPEVREKLQSVVSMVTSVYIGEEGFNPAAYYPIAEIVVLTLAQQFEGVVDYGVKTGVIKIDGKDFDLASINIESILIENQTFIFKLLPGARELENQERVRRYAAIKRFLQAV